VSEAGVLSHARVNSKSVRGAVGGGCNAAVDVAVGAGAGATGCCCDGGNGGEAGIGGSPVTAAGFFVCGSSAVSARAGTSRVLNAVSFPRIRKMPPPTRPADFFSSRTCFASLNDAGFDFWVAAATSDEDFGSDGGVSNTRELMAFKRSISDCLVSMVDVGVEGVSSSTMVICTRRCFGGTKVVEDDGVGLSMDEDRCATVTVAGENGKENEQNVPSFPCPCYPR
jgi:hypothetical protein